MRPVHRLLPAFAALCLVLAPPVSALTFAEMTYTCPIGGEVFTQRRPASGTGFGMELDMKPFGALIAPWPLPVCPGNGFVIYKDEEDFSAAERERLTAYVASDGYRTLVADDTPYYRAAMLMRAAGDDSVPAAVVLLRATWEAQADAQYTRYAEAALAAYRLEIAQEPAPAAPDMASVTRRLLVGELLRRLSRFDEAESEFIALQAALAGDIAPAAIDPVVPVILRYQRELIAQRDAQPHRVPGVEQDRSEAPGGDVPENIRAEASAAAQAAAEAAAEAAEQAALESAAAEEAANAVTGGAAPP